MPIAPHPQHHPQRQAPAPDEPSFALVHCPSCARDVLTAGEIDDAGRLFEVCVHCAARVPTGEAEARWVAAGVVLSLGYTVEGETGEASGKRGCRGGTCGVRQPDL